MEDCFNYLPPKWWSDEPSAVPPAPATENSPMASEHTTTKLVDMSIAAFGGLICGVVLCIVLSTITSDSEKKGLTQVEEINQAQEEYLKGYNSLGIARDEYTITQQKPFIAGLEETRKARLKAIEQKWEAKAAETTAQDSEVNDLDNAVNNFHNTMSLLNTPWINLTPEYRQHYIKVMEEIHKRRMDAIKKKWEASPRNDEDIKFINAKLESISKHVDSLILKEYGR
jgi:hypothetical protein